MARPKKRSVASRQSAMLSAGAIKKRRRDSSKELQEQAQEIPDSGPSEGELSEVSDIEMDSESDVEVSDAEDDVLKHEQPAKGWKEAERNLAGYSKTNMGKIPWSRWYYKENAKKKDSEGTLLGRNTEIFPGSLA